MNVLENAVMCLRCGNVIVSKRSGILVTCPCGNIAISGGRKKLERYGKEDSYFEKSIVEVECRKKV